MNYTAFDIHILVSFIVYNFYRLILCNTLLFNIEIVIIKLNIKFRSIRYTNEEFLNLEGTIYGINEQIAY